MKRAALVLATALSACTTTAAEPPQPEPTTSTTTPPDTTTTTLPTTTTTAKRHSHRRRPPQPRMEAPEGGGVLERIARCESGLNPRAVSASGKYRGLLQFDRQTWESVGGTGDPAAASASEQYERGAELMRRRGTQPWPHCGRKR